MTAWCRGQVCICLVFNHRKDVEHEKLGIWRSSHLETDKSLSQVRAGEPERWEEVISFPVHWAQRCSPRTRGSPARGSSETSLEKRVTAFKSHMVRQLKLSEEFRIYRLQDFHHKLTKDKSCQARCWRPLGSHRDRQGLLEQLSSRQWGKTLHKPWL